MQASKRVSTKKLYDREGDCRTAANFQNKILQREHSGIIVQRKKGKMTGGVKKGKHVLEQ